MKRHSIFPVVALALALLAKPALARQADVPDPLTLNDAVNYALGRYPALRARMAGIAAAEAGVALARTANLPKVDTLLSVNRATRNNISGTLFPQSVIPAISGPVLGGASGDSTFGSAAGALFAWEPLDFGLRKANVGVAAAKRDEAAAQLDLTRHQVAFAVADAFLFAAANQQAARAAAANVTRLRTIADTVHVLVENQIRPGADESRIQVELALARTQQIRADQRVAESLATLAEMLGAAGATVHIAADNLVNAPPSAPPSAEKVESHPLALASMATIRTSEARQKALDRSYFPRFTLQGAVWGRGTGALTDGSFLGGTNGLGLTTSNGALGVTLTFPLSDFASLRQKKAIERHTAEAETAIYDQTVQKLAGDLARARAERDGAQKVAENTPSELRAARAIDEQSRARYQAGLGTIIEVAEAQRLLAQSEIDDAVARLAVWRARLSEAAAAGDIQAALK